MRSLLRSKALQWTVVLIGTTVVIGASALAYPGLRASTAHAASSPGSSRLNAIKLCTKISQRYAIPASQASSDQRIREHQASDAFQRCLNDHERQATAQDARWLSLKNAHRMGPNAAVSATPFVIIDSRKVLSTTVVSNTVETKGNTWVNGVRTCINDDAGTCYIDRYYWSFCGAGAVDNALYYRGVGINTYQSGSYTEPSYAPYRRTTYWTASDHNRSYEMYIAEQSMPPSFGSPGLVSFGTYPSAGAVLNDVTDVLNWEGSGHNTSTWRSYFYVRVYNYSSGGNLTQSKMDSDIHTDIDSYNSAVVTEVNTNDLTPYWSSTSNNIHYITVMGYDDVYQNPDGTLGIYYYTDTCGTVCGSSQDGGIRQIQQNKLYQAIMDVGSGGGYSW
jgi:hypothetical protein